MTISKTLFFKTILPFISFSLHRYSTNSMTVYLKTTSSKKHTTIHFLFLKTKQMIFTSCKIPAT